MIELAPADYAWAVETARRACNRLGIPFGPDVAQEARVAAWLASRDFDPSGPAKFRTWARKRVAYSMRQRARDERWQLTVLDAPSPDGDGTRAENLPDRDGDPARLAADAEAAARIRARLRGTDRLVVELRARGLTLREIGSRLGVTRQAVEERLARLRRAGASLTRMHGRT